MPAGLWVRERAAGERFPYRLQILRDGRPWLVLRTSRSHAAYSVRIASEERYPWRFPGATSSRGRLATGDYALMDGETALAVVERKTFENFLADLGVMAVLHQRLLELASHEHHAFVVEAPYEDFLDSRRLHHYTPAFCARAIAELYAAHPGLRLVFCANRKAANEWARHYFRAVWARALEEQVVSVRRLDAAAEPIQPEAAQAQPAVEPA